MSSHQHETFTLSELARTLHFNKATCHSMCSAMEKHGLLIRKPVEKTYSLGPALLRFAAAVAPEGREALEIARTEMALLADELSLTIATVSLVGDLTTVLAVRAPRGSRASIEVGSQRAWVPPIGPTFVAWAPAEVTDSWLSRIDQKNTAFTTSYFEQVLQDLRHRGYDVGYSSDPRTQILHTISTLQDMHESEHIRDALSDLMTQLEGAPRKASKRKKRHMNNLTAPIFGTDGQVVLTITLMDFKNPLSSAEEKKLGSRLLKSVEQVTKSIHGALPEDWPSAS